MILQMGTRRRQPKGRTVRSASIPRPHDPQGRSPPELDYRRLFELAPDAILIVDREGFYVEANPAALVLTGYTLDELRTMRVGDLAVPSDRDFSAERFSLLQDTGQTRADRVILRKDGTIVPVEARANALGDGTFQTTLRDVSEAARARCALQESLAAYSTLVDLCHAAVISSGADGRIHSWNPAAEELFGYSAQEAVGRAISMLVPPRLRRKHRSGFEKRVRLSTHERFGRTIQVEGLRKDGTEVSLEISLAVARQGDDLIFTAVVRDITEFREMVEQLNDALQRLQFQLDRMPLAYIVWDVDFRVTEWNPAAERMFGYTKAEAINRQAYELIVPPDITAAVETIWADLLAGDALSHSINPNVRKDGRRLTCEWFNTPLRDSTGRIRGVASMATDVSEREAVEARVRDAQKLESLGVLAGGVAHDFNSSLMVILGNATLLKGTKGLSSNAMEHLELIETAGSRASELVRHLLTYARTGRHNPQPTDINAVIHDTTKLLRSSIGNAHELSLQLSDSLLTVVADKNQVAQVLLNLCWNAKDAMQDGGTIRVKTRVTELTPAQIRPCVPYDAEPGNYVEIIVGDTGIGMTAETVARIFDPFFTTKAEGHGLGMAAVLGILRQHHAAAKVESKPGKGTKMHVYFPIGGADPHPVQGAKPADRVTPSRSPARRKR